MKDHSARCELVVGGFWLRYETVSKIELMIPIDLIDLALDAHPASQSYFHKWASREPTMVQPVSTLVRHRFFAEHLSERRIPGLIPDSQRISFGITNRPAWSRVVFMP